jgi:predicted metal-dependent HD superfamily phosphohydrolase
MNECLILDLTRRYCEPHRHYHSIEHIANMLFLGRDLDLSDEQVYAIWYHDAIYDSRSETNEEDSADLAVQALRSIGWNDASLDLVNRMILDTKKHMATIPQSEIVIDLDLSSIAADWPDYERNRENIRREYDWIPDEEFAEGTRRFLQSFLDRDQIFRTEWGSTLELRARENMRRALDAMA